MKMYMTNHVVNDRMDRMLMIAEHIGWGEPILTFRNEKRQNIQVMTSTGVMLIKTMDNQCLITAYVATVEQVKEICKYCGLHRIPAALYNVAVKNQKRVARWA